MIIKTNSQYKIVCYIFYVNQNIILKITAVVKTYIKIDNIKIQLKKLKEI